MQCLPLLWDLTICVLCDPQIWWYFINPPNMPTEKKIRTKIIIYIPTFVHSGLPWVNHSFIIEHFPYKDIFVFVTCYSLWLSAPEKTEAFLKGLKLFWKLSERAETFWSLSERAETENGFNPQRSNYTCCRLCGHSCLSYSHPGLLSLPSIINN